MPLTKKIILTLVATIFLVNIFSGCILDDIFGGTTFTINSWKIDDDEGFPGIFFNFSCSDSVTIKLLDPNSIILDSNYFLRGQNETILHLAEYRHSVIPGTYKIKAYDSDNKEIYSQLFILDGSDLKIPICEQKWWKREAWIGGYSLLGLRLTVQNSGDTPAYPYEFAVTMDSQTITSLAIPSFILPGESGYVDSLVYRDSEPVDNTFMVSLTDRDENEIASSSFSVFVEDNVPIKQFNWQYLANRRINIPNPEYLFNYQTSLDRINDEDYGLYIFDPYDDQYIEILLDIIMFGFTGSDDAQIINYVASFVQSLPYKSDSENNDSFEYPRYPIETLFYDGSGGDCEDKAIITAALLHSLGYDVALMRLPNHMAVGVKLSEDAIPNYNYYIDDYYFLETTTQGKTCGFIPTEYRGSTSDVTIYPISSRPLLIHNWKDGTMTIYTNTEMGDFVKVNLVVENHGIETATMVKTEGAFYTTGGLKSNSENEYITSLEAGMKKEVMLMVNIPTGWTTYFRTKIYLNNEVVDEKESSSTFPT